MKNSLDCEVVHDLLPSYIDGLTSEVTNQQVESHLEDCTGCSEILASMKEKEKSSVYEDDEMQQAEIDYFRRTKKRNRCKIIFSVVTTMVLLVVAGYIYLYAIARPLDLTALDVQVTVDGERFEIEGSVVDDMHIVTEINFHETNGIAVAEVKGTYKTPFVGNSFSGSYGCSNKIRQVWIGDDVVWDDGTDISKKVSDLYQSKNPYVGNASADLQILEYLDVSGTLGPYQISLQTDKKPYGCDITLLKNIGYDEQGPAELRMQSYLCVMLALIDNMGTASFHYSVDGEEMSLTVTEKYATSLVCKDIKSCADTPTGLTELMVREKLLEAYPDPFYEEVASDCIRINVVTSLPIEVDMINIALMDGDNLLDNTSVKDWNHGNTFSVDISSEDLEGDITGNLLAKVSFHSDKLGKDLIDLAPVSITWVGGMEYELVIAENETEGYNIDIGY